MGNFPLTNAMWQKADHVTHCSYMHSLEEKKRFNAYIKERRLDGRSQQTGAKVDKLSEETFIQYVGLILYL